MALDNTKKDLKRPDAMNRQQVKKNQNIPSREIPKPENKRAGITYEERIKRAKNVIKESFLRELLFVEDADGNEVENSSITDISFNGTDMYIQDNEIGRYKVDSDKDPRIKAGKEPLMVTPKMVEDLGNQVQNTMGDAWNTTNPILDSELGELRTNFMHKAVSPFGVTFALRVSRPRLAITDISTLCDKDTAKLLEVFMRCDFNLLISGQTGSGKALTNDTKIPTPLGWTTMGELKVGDYVFDRLGKPTKITGVYPQGLLDTYKVTLKDGREILCNDEHIWSVFTSKGNLKNMTVREMLDNGIFINDNPKHAKYYIPMNEAVEYPKSELKVDPYVLGAFIGDGSLMESKLTISSEDIEIPKIIAEKLGTEYKHVPNSSKYRYNFLLPKNHDFNLYHKSDKNLLTKHIFPQEWCHKSYDKFIPKEYLTSSIEQRFELLQGLLDTDGSITKDSRGTITYKTVSEQLAKDVNELAFSLGMKSTIKKYISKQGYLDSYNVYFNVPNEIKPKMFKLSRKKEIAEKLANNPKRARYDRVAISNIEKLDFKSEMTCIMVDNNEHLFQAGLYGVTHNTELQKALIGYIPQQKKISLMEDTLDSHIKEIYPEKDINSWATAGEKGEDNYIGFPDLIRAGLRNNPDWLMISEVRGAEAQDLLSAALTGHSIMTTLHATGADNIPSRLSNMVSMNEQASDYEALQLDIVSVLNLGLHMERVDDPETGKISRIIREIYEYTEYRQGIGIIGVPIYQVTQEYDEETNTYHLVKLKNRLSKNLLEKITKKKEIHNVPDVYAKGDSY